MLALSFFAEHPMPERVNRSSVALYYLIACGIAWPIFWIRDKTPEI
jgi:hypothetical protein